MNRKTRIAIHIIALILGTIGTSIVVINLGWMATIGIFIILWANNMGNADTE